QVLAGNLCGGLLCSGPGPGISVGVPPSVEQPRHHPQYPSDRVSLLPPDLGQPLPPQPLEISLAEGGVEDHVRVQLEGGVEPLPEGFERNAGDIEPGAGPEVGAELRQT